MIASGCPQVVDNSGALSTGGKCVQPGSPLFGHGGTAHRRPLPPNAGRTPKARKEAGEYEPGKHDQPARICDRRTEVLAELADADAAGRDPTWPHPPSPEPHYRGMGGRGDVLLHDQVLAPAGRDR